MAVNLGSEARLECPNCDAQVVLPSLPDKPVLHPCKGMRGFHAPMVLAGADCKVEAVEREDYVGDEIVQTDGEGRPVMNVTTTHADGHTDVVVYAPKVVVDMREFQ